MDGRGTDNKSSVVHALRVLGGQVLPGREETVIEKSPLSAESVTRNDEVNGLLWLWVVFVVVTKKILVPCPFRKLNN